MHFRIFAAVAAVAAVGCQTYDFEPVRPLAVAQTVKPVNIVSKEAKPNLFLVVDKSGSMNFSADERAMCASCASSACGANGCVTRIAALKASMASFLGGAGAVGHLGYVPYPNTSVNACGIDANAMSPNYNNGVVINDIATEGVELDLDAPDDTAGLQMTANAINTKIQAINPAGGTPSGATLRGLRDYGPLLNKSRSNYVLLLTDGLPNCNQLLPAQTCQCTASVGAGQPCAVGGLNQCLDRDGTVADITTLRSSGIKTIVVGFGAELASGTGTAVDVLSAMGAAGGFQRPCTQNSDCGAGDTCSVMASDPCGRQATVCARTFFTAQNAQQLTDALNTISESIKCTDPCTQFLSARPTNDIEELVSVIVDGANVQPGMGTWRYDPSGPSVVFPQGTPICSRMLNATSASPVKLEIRIVESL